MKATRLIGAVAFAAAHAVVGVGCSSTPTSVAAEQIGTSQEALTTCTTLTAIGDAVLSNPPMNQSFGTLPILRVGGKDESLVRFDLGAIPSAAALDSATLTLYVSGNGSDAPVNVHRATVAWDENTVTYASFAQRFDSAVVGAIITTSPNVLKSVDLTPLVTSWITGAQSNFGVFLETSSNKRTVIVSREGGTAEQKPALRVCYTVPDNHCSPNPCANGSTCENGSSGFTCHCVPGYTGARCETLINNCASNPCQNGAACTNGTNSYGCTCPTGYSGTNCEINIDDCAPNRCQNGGVCQDGIGSYTCSCAPGYAGASCETLIDNCASSPCQNRAACTDGTNSYTCTCAAGYSGTRCEINIDDCASQPCRNGGTCIDGINAYTCSCPPDWGGAACDVNLNTCAQHPCLNGSTCTNGVGTYACTCAAGFSGANCEVDINDCAVNHCLNGGICVDGVNSFTCTCANGYTGATCQNPPANVTRTPWQMHDGLGATDTQSNLVMFSCQPTIHAQACEYDLSTVPPSVDPAWRAAPDASSIGYFLSPSRVCSAPNGRTCFVYGDFTYFQTYIDVPAGASVTQLTISATHIDEGARIRIYNSLSPTGVIAGYLNPNGMVAAVSGELAHWIQPGEASRIVIEQVDDCCSESGLVGVVITLNGQVL